MSVTIRRVHLWRTEIPNKPGALADALEPLAQAKADLTIVHKGTIKGRPGRATVEILPAKGRRATLAARAAGFSVSPTPVLLVEGDNRPGLASAVMSAAAWAGITVQFLSAQVVGHRYSALLSFGSEEDARRAGSLIRKVAGGNAAAAAESARRR